MEDYERVAMARRNLSSDAAFLAAGVVRA